MLYLQDASEKVYQRALVLFFRLILSFLSFSIRLFSPFLDAHARVRTVRQEYHVEFLYFPHFLSFLSVHY